MSKKALIIGAGLGGLCTALRLCQYGYDVEIVEKHHQAGGRLNQFKKDGFTFDVGPSFFSMSYEFKEFFETCGIPISKLPLTPLDPVYSVHFAKDSKRYDIHRDLDKLAAEFKAIEPEFLENVKKYLKNAGKIFHDTEHKIIKKNFPTLASYALSMATVPWHHAPLMFRSMWTELGKYFKSEDVKVIFSLVAFFLGSTPFNTPAVYSLLNYTELIHDGYWQVEGGMYKITELIVDELKKHGVKFTYNTEIIGFEAKGNNVKNFTSSDGKKWSADVMVCNADAASFRGMVMEKPKYNTQKLNKMKWTLAPFTIYLGVQGKIPQLNHHNYFLGDNFKDYASDIFTTSISPDKPYYYVNMPSKSDPTCALAGCENIFILCPVPDKRFKPDWSDSEQLSLNIINDLGQRIGIDLQANILTKTVWTPDEWEQKFNLYQGSGLGLAHGLDQIGALRPANKDEKYNNLYYVGASTTPGTGLPIVVISSNLVTQRIIKDNEAV
ncbi:MAG: phytoene desaturase family protein [Bacteroidota bacterium]|nr:phytoene desaturase family protein [Bacteroidota bacterium]